MAKPPLASGCQSVIPGMSGAMAATRERYRRYGIFACCDHQGTAAGSPKRPRPRSATGVRDTPPYPTKSTPVSVLLYSAKVWLVCSAYTQVLMVPALVSTVNSRTGLVVSECIVVWNE